MADKKLNSLSFPGLSDRYIIPPGAVFVGYQFGTNAEIESAYQNSTPVFCSVAPSFGQTPVICRLVKRSSATLHYFAGIDEFGVMHFATCSSDTWTRSTLSISPETATPQPLGTASAGVAEQYSRGDHVHAMPTAAQVGAIAAPASPASGAFLVYNGTAWVAQTLPTYNGGSY